MEQLLANWNALEPRRRIVALVAALGVFAAVLGLARLAAQPGMSLLYAGLEGAAAGDVIAALDQRGLPYEVRGDAIYVPTPQRDETRMALAAQGLPAASATGYELLDGLTGFGTTAQMFDAAYWRAKEGELARTITASPHIRFARVHIAQGTGQTFRRESQISASVTVTPSSAAVTPQQAQALRFLVASAVAGLDAADVSVIDSNGALIVADDQSLTARGSDRAEHLRRNVLRMLEARVGPGRAVVEVNVETVTDRETIVERRIDPAARTAVSQETEERSSSSSDSRRAAVSVASNLPDGDAAGGDGSAQSREETIRERTDWDVSQTSREIERAPGAIRRLTVAVLVDGVRDTTGQAGAPWTPRSDDELAALRDLVASTVGFDEARGDVITLRSLPFEPVDPSLGTAGSTDWVTMLGLDAMGLIRLVALALVALFLGLFVVRPILRPARRDDPGAAQLTDFALPAPASGPVLSGVIEDGAGPSSAGATALAARGALVEAQPVDPVERMRALIADRQDETLEILRSWMDEPEVER